MHFVGLFFVFITENARSKKQNTLMKAAPLCPFSSSKIMRYVSKTFSDCRKMLMRLPVDRFELGIFIAGTALRISEATKYESM